MAETLQITYADPTVHSMDLGVTLTGRVITVSSGSIVAHGLTHVLSADESFTVTSSPYITEVMGYLVLDTTNGDSLRLFVDAVDHNGIKVPYDFGRGGDYTLLYYLFQVIVPANTTDLTGIDHLRWQVIEQL